MIRQNRSNIFLLVAACLSLLERDVTIDGTIVVPRGSTGTGRLLDVKGSARVKGRAEMTLVLTEIAVERNNTRYRPTRSGSRQREPRGVTQRSLEELPVWEHSSAGW